LSFLPQSAPRLSAPMDKEILGDIAVRQHAAIIPKMLRLFQCAFIICRSAGIVSSLPA
jgi:hypothetical protein